MLTEFYIPGVVEAAQTLEDLDNALLTLRFDLGKLEAAWARAFAPIEARVVPMLDKAVRAVTDFVNAAGSVIAALFGGVQLQAKKTVTVTGSSLKRALADFDQLDRLPGGSGSGTYTVPAQLKAIPAEFQRIADSIKKVLAPLGNIDFSAAVSALGRLREAVMPFVRGLFAGLEWAWYNILVPMAAWGAEQALPVFLDALSAIVGSLGAVLTAARPVFSWFWENLLKPMAQWTGGALLGALEAVSFYFRGLKGIMELLSPLAKVLSGALGLLQTAVQRICAAFGLWNEKTGTMGAGLVWLEGLGQDLARVFGTVTSALTALGQKLGTVFSALSPALRQAANGAIALVNTAMSAIESALNAMVEALRSFRIDIPKWVPGLGGQKFGLDLGYVSLPRIPALAQGAVLPANRPFLALVGDQKNGTNIEAPLATIQEALANVLDREATNDLLAQILTAIEGIQVGDETIGRAARRYENRMAVMGGVV